MFCKSCNQDKSDKEFYISDRNHCKECIKSRVRQNRLKNINYYREFDRKRNNLPHRIKARKIYQQTDNYKKSHNAANKKFRENNIEIYNAHSILNNAIRCGKIQSKPCLICGKIGQAHHFDYSLPLNVIWLCDEHHKNIHKVENEIKRQIKELNL